MPQTIYGALAIIYRDTSAGRVFLIIQNQKSTNYTLVGGASEGGENALDTVRREIKEEINWNVNSLDIMVLPLKHEFVFNNKKLGRAGHAGSYQFFSIKSVKDNFDINQNDIIQYLWLPLDKALEIMAYDDLKEVFSKAVKLI